MSLQEVEVLHAYGYATHTLHPQAAVGDPVLASSCCSIALGHSKNLSTNIQLQYTATSVKCFHTSQVSRNDINTLHKISLR